MGRFNKLLNILSSAIASLTNPSKLSAIFKSVKNKTISKETIIKYIDYLKDSFLIDRYIDEGITGNQGKRIHPDVFDKNGHMSPELSK